MYHRLNNENVDDESSPDGSKDEADYLSPVPISGRYRSTSLHDETVPVPRFYIPCCGLIFYIMAFFGFFSAEIIHEGLSVAIVAMVNRTAFAEKYAVMSNVTADQCPRDPELLLGGGEFNWNRKQQGIVLAAYFYVHGLTEVQGLHRQMFYTHDTCSRNRRHKSTPFFWRRFPVYVCHANL